MSSINIYNRRQFLRALGVGTAAGFSGWAAGATVAYGAGGGKVKIERIELYPLRYPLTGYFKFFTGPHGSQGRAAVIVKVTADNGMVGWGQSVPVAKWAYESLETATIALQLYYAPVLIGHDPLDIEGAHAKMDQAMAPGFSTGMPITRAGIDIALHDLAGKILGKSLCQMWGKPKGGPIDLSWTVNVRTLKDADGLIDEGWKRGYRNFNIKVAPDPAYDVQLAQRVKQRAPKGFLWADANGGYDVETALAAAPKLADVGVDVLEAPIKPNQIRGYQKLKKQGALPILMDEGVISPVEAEEFIRLKMIDGIAMKPSRCGGLISCKRQIEIILENELLWLGSGLCDPDISLAATLHLYGAFNYRKPAALNGPQFITADVLEKPLAIKDGKGEVPTGAGLGIEVDEAKIIKLMSRQKSTS